MDLELHAAHDHMDLIQNGANSWMEDDFQDNNELCITCASLCSVAMVVTDVFQINWFSMKNKICKISKIFGKIEDPENQGVIKGLKHLVPWFPSY
jgi:hypothetical protein